MLIDKTRLYDCWYEDENGVKYNSSDDLDYDNHTFTYHSCFPNVVTEVVDKIENNKFINIENKRKSWDERLILAMFSSGDFKLSEAIKISTSCCERCSNVLYAKYLGRKIFYKSYLLKDWKNQCDFCQLSDDKYFS